MALVREHEARYPFSHFPKYWLRITQLGVRVCVLHYSWREDSDSRCTSGSPARALRSTQRVSVTSSLRELWKRKCRQLSDFHGSCASWFLSQKPNKQIKTKQNQQLISLKRQVAKKPALGRGLTPGLQGPVPLCPMAFWLKPVTGDRDTLLS